MAELLEHFGVVVIPATVKNFIIKDKFVVSTDKNSPVEILYIGRDFLQWFLGKIEKPKIKTILRYSKLVKLSADEQILAELGGKAETHLSDVYSLMERQKNGESGVLLINVHANIFYVRDTNNVLRAVNIFWHGNGWGVNAFSVVNTTFIYGCYGRYRFFSCN